MADSVIITNDADPAPDGSAFAAGVAAATAGQAAETADAAVALAVEANVTAAAAVEQAFNAEAEIAALRAEIVGELDRFGETLTDLVGVLTEEVDDGPAPAIVTSTAVTVEPHKGDPDKDKTPAGRSKKADWWWGTRR